MNRDAGLVPSTAASPQGDFDPAVRRLPDNELLGLARDGRRSAAVELWRRHGAYGLAVAHGLTPEEDWESISSRAWALVLSPDGGDGSGGGFRPYLYFMIRAISSPEELTGRRETYLAAAYHDLPPRWHEALWYAHIESMRPAQIARFMGLDPDSMPQLLHRARQGLRQEWVQHHIAAIADDSDCRLVWEYSGAYIRGVLTSQEKAWLEEHIATCPQCRHAVSDAVAVAAHLPSVVLPMIAGNGGAANLLDYLHTNGPAVRSSLDLPDSVEALYRTHHRSDTAHTTATTADLADSNTTVSPTIDTASAPKDSAPLATQAPHRPTMSPLSPPAHSRGLADISDLVTRSVASKTTDTLNPRENPPRPGAAPRTGSDDTNHHTDSRHLTHGPTVDHTSQSTDQADELLLGPNTANPIDPRGINRLAKPTPGSAISRTSRPGFGTVGVIIAVIGLVILAIIALILQPWRSPVGEGEPGGQPATNAPATVQPSADSNANLIRITGVDTGSDNTLLPLVQGTAPAGSAVTVHIGEATLNLLTNDLGQWTTAGQQFESSTARGQIEVRAEGIPESAVALYQLATPPALTPATDNPSVVSVQGAPDAAVELLVNGTSATQVTLDAVGFASTDLALSPGTHFIQSRYRLDDRFGPVSEAVAATVP